jgi:hypothetical protein
MRTVIRAVEIVLFACLVWGAVSVLRYLSGEPWASILHQPLWFL